jgi:TM2 domain-containing membrane protein YozV
MDTTELLLLRDMSVEQRQMYSMEMTNVRKKPSTTLLLNFFALHYFYLEQPGLGILQWFLCFFVIGIFWVFLDLFRSKHLTDRFNSKKAVEIAGTVKMLYPGK